MQVNELNFLKFLQVSNQFRIPVYQRTYRGTRDPRAELWRDILRAAMRHVVKSDIAEYHTHRKDVPGWSVGCPA